MTDQLTFDALQGEAERDAAIRAVDAGADLYWKAAALFAVNAVANEYIAFTTDDVWQALADEGFGGSREPRAMGAVMTLARKRGVCVPTERVVASLRPECHRRPLRVWESRCLNAST